MGRLWKLQEGQRRPGIEFTSSEKNGGHQPPSRTTVYELNPQSATVSHLVFPTLCSTNQPRAEQALGQCTLLLLPSGGSQSINSGHICCVAGMGTVRRRGHYILDPRLILNSSAIEAREAPYMPKRTTANTSSEIYSFHLTPHSSSTAQMRPPELVPTCPCETVTYRRPHCSGSDQRQHNRETHTSGCIILWLKDRNFQKEVEMAESMFRHGPGLPQAWDFSQL